MKTPQQDMLQEGYAIQWGAEGRNDLGRMKASACKFACVCVNT